MKGDAMKDGNYVIYLIQAKVTHKTPWGKPKEPLEAIPDQEWFTFGWDSMGYIAEPVRPEDHPNQKHEPLFPESSQEVHEVWAETGFHGWRTLRYAVLGLKRVRAASEAGKFDYKDSYRTSQGVRHSLKLIKLTLSQLTEEVSSEDLMNAIFGDGQNAV